MIVKTQVNSALSINGISVFRAVKLTKISQQDMKKNYLYNIHFKS